MMLNLHPIHFKDLFLDYECIPNLIHIFYKGIIGFNEVQKAEKLIFITLCGDAASLKNFTKSKSVVLYVLKMLLFKKYYHPNGSSPKNICFLKILKELFAEAFQMLWKMALFWPFFKAYICQMFKKGLFDASFSI